MRQLAKILADSIQPEGIRLTTMEVVMPRIVLAEFNTHRTFSRNSASSRAIPVQKMIQAVLDDPYIPETWGRNGSGMQAKEELSEQEARIAEVYWRDAAAKAVESARLLLREGVHKQVTNRLLEPFMWHTVICTAAQWSNFFNLRCHPDAHPAIQNTAYAMRDAMEKSVPKCLQYGEWHLPLVDDRDGALSVKDKVKVSSARCARVSYLTHDGVRDPSADIFLHDRLLKAGHMSPFEHPAKACELGEYADLNPMAGNFGDGWVQYRKTIPWEFDIHARPQVYL